MHEQKSPMLPQFPGCFVCGADNPKGLNLRFDVTSTGSDVRFTAEPTHAGYSDVVHGGIISALLDEAMIWACYGATGRFGVTAELKIRFRKPVKVGVPCHVYGEMTDNHSKIWTATARIIDEMNMVLADGKGRIFPGNPVNHNA